MLFSIARFLYICNHKTLKIMVTININERTKAGKTLLELAKILAVANKGVMIEVGMNGATKSRNKLLEDFELACKQLQESRKSKIKRKSLDELLNEK